MVPTYAPKVGIASRHETFKNRMQELHDPGLKDARLALTREYATQIIGDVLTLDKELELAEQALDKSEDSEFLIKYDMTHVAYPWYKELEHRALHEEIPGVDRSELSRNYYDYGAFFCEWLVGKRKEYLETERRKLVEIFENLDWRPGEV